MDREENERVKAEIRKRLKELHPENCKHCGGFHNIRLSYNGTTLIFNGCCERMAIEANEVLRNTRKEMGDEYYQ